MANEMTDKMLAKKIAKAQEAVKNAQAELDELLKIKEERETKELLEIIKKSGKSADEIKELLSK